MVYSDTNLCRSITMDFQPWKDYFQLASLVQKMTLMDTGKPRPAKPLLIYPAELTEDQAKGEDPFNGDSLAWVLPLMDELPSSCKPSYSYHNGPILSPNLNPKKRLAKNQYRPKTLDDGFQAEPEVQYKSSKVHPASSSTKREARPQSAMCYFCKHNGESCHVYTGHNLKDKQGKIICPILRMYTCSVCGATGDSSHTKKYCPFTKNKFCRNTERISASHRMRH